MKPESVSKSDHLKYALAGLKSSGVSMLYQDLDLKIRFSANLPASWHCDQDLDGKSDDVLFAEPHAARVMAAKRQVIETGEPDKLEILRDADQDRHWYMLHIDPEVDSKGRIVGVITTILDIDDLKYRETVLKTLLRELSHRSKNLLAMVQSIASQTARSSDDLEEFLPAFRNRIQSMAQSQDLVTASDWRGAELFALTESQLQPLMGKVPARFNMKGEDAYLFPNAARHLGLALHELAIDSLARGALGPAGGDIVLDAEERRNEENEPELVVTWTETFTRPPETTEARPAPKSSFSGTVLGRIVPQALSASVWHETRQDRMVYRLTIPNTQYEID